MADLPTGPKERKSTVLSIEDEAIIVAFRRHTFSSPSAWRGSRPTDKLFTRIRGVIKDGFADPDLGPCEVAAEAGISLRYLQKLFTERGSTCSEFIYSLRLDHAARLLRRRNKPASERDRLRLRSISHENFTIGSVMRQAPTQKDLVALAAEQCAPVGESASLAHDIKPPAN